MTRRQQRIPAAIVIGCMTMVLFSTAATADVLGQIMTTQGRKMTGKIRWQPASKVYVITGNNNVALQIPLNEVASVRVQKPDTIESAINLVKGGDYGKAIPVLEKIRSEYNMLEWDVTAAQWLAEAYLNTGEAAKAVRMCEGVIEADKEKAYTGDLPRVYWRALLEADREATLNRQLDEAIEKGKRDIVAAAQVARGDLERKKGNFREALIDGYLRSVALFEDVREVRSEALYKAAKCFEQLGELSNMEKMRRKLLEEYPGSVYAEQMRSGA